MSPVHGCASLSHVRILLMRHGQGFHNKTHEDIPDALLTPDGELQASSWASVFAGCENEKSSDKSSLLGLSPIDLVLVSPLRRTIQTACLAFAEPGKSHRKMEFCRNAREMWWNELVNQFSEPSSVIALLEEHSVDVDLKESLAFALDGTEKAKNEIESLRELKIELRRRSKKLAAEFSEKKQITIAVVAHFGTIRGLTGKPSHNCDVLECIFRDESLDECGASGKLLRVLKVHSAPSGPQTS